MTSSTGRGDSKKRSVQLTRSQIMSRVKSKDSKAELALRSALHREGLRFRLHQKIEKISVDIVFPGPRVVVFVDGCFWHGCPEHASYPKTNQDYWLPKLEANKERDARHTIRLRGSGWEVIRIWEHDCLPVSKRVLRRIIEACRSHRA